MVDRPEAEPQEPPLNSALANKMLTTDDMGPFDFVHFPPEHPDAAQLAILRSSHEISWVRVPIDGSTESYKIIPEN
jgi:hypothetical protein